MNKTQNNIQIEPEWIFLIEYEHENENKPALMLLLDNFSIEIAGNFNTVVKEKDEYIHITINNEEESFTLIFKTIDCFNIMKNFIEIRTLLIATKSQKKQVVFHFTEEEVEDVSKIILNNQIKFNNLSEEEKVSLKLLETPILYDPKKHDYTYI